MHRFNRTSKQRVVPAEANDRSLPFSVEAGKIEHDDRGGIFKNFKYINQFASLEEAMAAVDTCQGYDFIDLTYTTSDGKVWEVEVTPSCTE